jgi:hypothetical protein
VSEDFNAFGGSFAGGNATVFGGGSLGVINFDDLDESATTIDGTLGAGGPVDQRRRVHVCGLGNVQYHLGPDFDSVELNTFAFSAGGQAGIVAAETATVAVVPTFGAAFNYFNVMVDSPDGDDSASETYGSVIFGVGLIFNRRFAITPTIAVPFGLDDNDAVFTLGFTFNFGR